MTDSPPELVPIGWVRSGLKHRAEAPKLLAVHPRRDLSQPLHGVFATRSPDRPNPIGLHRCGCSRWNRGACCT